MNLQSQLKSFISSRDREKLDIFLDNYHDIDVVQTLDGFNDEDLNDFISLLDYETTAGLVEDADDQLQKRILKNFSNEDIIEIFTHMSLDDIADIMAMANIGVQKELFRLMKNSDESKIKMLLSYDEDSAGGLMTTEFIAIKESYTIHETLEKIREIGPKTEVIEEIFVIGYNRELVGIVDLRNILISDGNLRLEEIMKTNLVTIYPHEDQEDAAKLVSKYDLKVLPVINRNNQILGIITVDDIIDVIYEEHSEDLKEMGGVSGQEEIDSTIKESIKNRLPWLLLNLITAFLSSLVISRFSRTMSAVIALAAISPIVTGLSGNSGNQTLSVTIVNIATGQIDIGKIKKYVQREFSLGLLNGFCVGLIAGLVIFFMYKSIYISLILLFSLTICLAISNTVGFLIPLLMVKLNFNPQLSSGIFLTAISDVLGNFVFLSLATIFLSFLI